MKPSDIPVLLDLFSERYGQVPERKNVHVGAQFALASLCAPGLQAVMQAVCQETFDEIEAIDTLHFIAEFDHCDAVTRKKAEDSIALVGAIRKANHVRVQGQYQKRQADDVRIQANALATLDPDKKKNLNYEERDAVFKRSVKAMGLEGHRTPEQEALYQRMYDSMVLNKSDKER